MAKYTIELRKIEKSIGREELRKFFTNWELSDYLTPEEIKIVVEAGHFSKDRLADHIIDKYYMREIGLETVGLFKLQAKVAMREIMERQAPRLYSASIRYDLFEDTDFTETTTTSGGIQTSSTGSSTSTGSGLTVNSDTPQGQISKKSILDGNYASSTGANETENSVNDITSSNQTSETTQTYHVQGNRGISTIPQRMIKMYRDNIIQIMREISDDLASLFMGIY